VAKSIALARGAQIPVYVIGVGTTGRGVIPEPPPKLGSILPPPTPIYSVLDRNSLSVIASAGEGQYFEIGRESDRDIANRIINSTRRRSGSLGIETTSRDLYWEFLIAAAALLVIGVLFMQERAELWLCAVGTAATLILLWTVTR
jgi:hypothetical protein